MFYMWAYDIFWVTFCIMVWSLGWGSFILLIMVSSCSSTIIECAGFFFKSRIVSQLMQMFWKLERYPVWCYGIESWFSDWLLFAIIYSLLSERFLRLTFISDMYTYLKLNKLPKDFYCLIPSLVLFFRSVI